METLVLKAQRKPHLNQATQKNTCQNFPTQNRKFQTHKNPLTIPRSLESRSPPPPPAHLSLKMIQMRIQFNHQRALSDETFPTDITHS